MIFLKYVKDKENMCRLRDSHKIRQKKRIRIYHVIVLKYVKEENKYVLVVQHS